MKVVFHGFPVGQVGPSYYNILHPSTQGTNWANLEKKFHTYFYTGTGEKKITDLTTMLGGIGVTKEP